MGLEERCGDEDMHVSTARIPIIREYSIDVTDGDSIEDSKIMEAIPQSQLPRTIYAPLGDAEFWIGIHLGLVSYAMREAEKQMLEVNVASTRISLIQNDLYKQFREKVQLQEEFKMQKNLAENYKFVIQLAMLLTQNKVEEKENILRMYEERFGSRDDLMKLAKAEENTKLPGMLGPRKYADISTLIKQHETGERPKTVGQRMADFAEKLLSPETYSNIVNALYAAFRGKEQRDDCCG